MRIRYRAVFSALFFILLTACGGSSSGTEDSVSDNSNNVPKNDASDNSDGNSDNNTEDSDSNSSNDSDNNAEDSDSNSSNDSENDSPASLTDFTTQVSGIKQLKFQWKAAGDINSLALFENIDGVSGFSAIDGADNLVGTAREYTLTLPTHLIDWTSARYWLEAKDEQGNRAASAELALDKALAPSAIGYFKASNSGKGDLFGSSIAVSGNGNTLAISAPFEDSNATGVNSGIDNKAAKDSGAVYIFTNKNGSWQQEAFIKASHTGSKDFFGRSLSLSEDGKTLAIGADGEDSNAQTIDGDQTNNAAPNSGAVYIFTSTESGWSQEAYIKASNAVTGDLFGHSVSLSASGNLLAIGAPGVIPKPLEPSQHTGATFIFARKNNLGWTEQARVTASNADNGDRFGVSVSLAGDGKTLAIGADNEACCIFSATVIDPTNNGGWRAGAAYVFTNDNSTWSEQAYIKASNYEGTDFFGSSVSLSADGNTLAVGAPAEDSDINSNGDPEYKAVIDSGAAYIFTRQNRDWSEQAYIKASNHGFTDRFGEQVALSADGKTLAIGAPNEDSNGKAFSGNPNDNSAANSGAVYILRNTEAGWQETYVKAIGGARGDAFGKSVALSYDGETLAVGAIAESSKSTGVSTNNQASTGAASAGAVYLY